LREDILRLYRMTQSRKTQNRTTQRRKRNAPLVKLTMNARGLTRNQLYMGRIGYGLNGMFKGNTMKRGYSGGGPSLNNTLTNRNLKNIKEVNTSALLENVMEHGQGNTYTSPHLTNKRLNDLPLKQVTPTRAHRIITTPNAPRKMSRRRNNRTRTPKRKGPNVIVPPAPKKSKKV